MKFSTLTKINFILPAFLSVFLKYNFVKTFSKGKKKIEYM